jgi:uncharacterized membrane protein
MADARQRRGYLDWLRGVAVLIMIEAHVMDSWTADPFRQSRVFGWALIVGGFGAPLFLFLAGISVALSAASKARRSGDAAASRAVVRRGLEIFGLAFVFRLQSWILTSGPAYHLLRVDILNIMGPSIAAAAALWGLGKSSLARSLAFGVTALVLCLATPPVRAAAWLSALPDPLEGYLRPIPGLTNFVVFPWAGFLFAGGAIGVLIERRRTADAESRLQRALAAGAAGLLVAAFGGSYLPSVYSRGSSFWTSSPSYFAIRCAILTLTVVAAYLWERRSDRPTWSPVQQLGRTSLFIYWIHVEMVYGDVSRSLHRRLSLVQAVVALSCFAVLMLGVSLAKDAIARRARFRARDQS